MKQRYKDWASWWDALRTKLIEAAGTAGATMLGTNGVANLGIDALKDMGMNWKTMFMQFLVHIALAGFNYIRTKPTADVVEREVETTTITKEVTVEKDRIV